MVSVIVPVWQKEWLNESLQSIKTENYKDLELIVESDPCKTGPAATRNRGLEKAAGEYILFCDSDDYLEPGAIDLLVRSIEGVDMVCGSFRKFGDFEQTVTHPTEILGMDQIAEYVMGNLRNSRTNQMLNGCWAKLFRREFIGRFPDLTIAEDMAFNFDYLSRCNNVRFISDIVYHNRKHNGSMTMNESDRPFGFLEGLKYVKAFLRPFYTIDEIEEALDSSKCYHAMLYFSRVAGCGQGTFRRIWC